MNHVNQSWCLTPVNLELRKWKQEDVAEGCLQLHREFEADMGDTRPLGRKRREKRKGKEMKESGLNLSLQICFLVPKLRWPESCLPGMTTL